MVTFHLLAGSGRLWQKVGGFQKIDFSAEPA